MAWGAGDGRVVLVSPGKRAAWGINNWQVDGVIWPASPGYGSRWSCLCILQAEILVQSCSRAWSVPPLKADTIIHQRRDVAFCALFRSALVPRSKAVFETRIMHS